MKKYYIAMLFFISFVMLPSYAGWNAQCLDDCFSTHHECNYCDYQCSVPDEIKNDYAPTRQYVCPFTEHNYY